MDIIVRQQDSQWVAEYGQQSWPCAIGKGGTCTPEEKQEGDGKTPLGTWPLRKVLFRSDRVAQEERAGINPEIGLYPLCQRDGWCDDPEDAYYNRPVVVPHPSSHELLWREDGLYDLIGILGYNDDPVESGKGSAIFLHIAKPDYAPTEGCVALSRADLLELLARIGPGTALRIEG